MVTYQTIECINNLKPAIAKSIYICTPDVQFALFDIEQLDLDDLNLDISFSDGTLHIISTQPDLTIIYSPTIDPTDNNEAEPISLNISAATLSIRIGSNLIQLEAVLQNFHLADNTNLDFQKESKVTVTKELSTAKALIKNVTFELQQNAKWCAKDNIVFDNCAIRLSSADAIFSGKVEFKSSEKLCRLELDHSHLRFEKETTVNCRIDTVESIISGEKLLFPPAATIDGESLTIDANCQEVGATVVLSSLFNIIADRSVYLASSSKVEASIFNCDSNVIVHMGHINARSQLHTTAIVTVILPGATVSGDSKRITTFFYFDALGQLNSYGLDVSSLATFNGGLHLPGLPGYEHLPSIKQLRALTKSRDIYQFANNMGLIVNPVKLGRFASSAAKHSNMQMGLAIEIFTKLMSLGLMLSYVVGMLAAAKKDKNRMQNWRLRHAIGPLITARSLYGSLVDLGASVNAINQNVQELPKPSFMHYAQIFLPLEVQTSIVAFNALSFGGIVNRETFMYDFSLLNISFINTINARDVYVNMNYSLHFDMVASETYRLGNTSISYLSNIRAKNLQFDKFSHVFSNYGSHLVSLKANILGCIILNNNNLAASELELGEESELFVHNSNLLVNKLSQGSRSIVDLNSSTAQIENDANLNGKVTARASRLQIGNNAELNKDAHVTLVASTFESQSMTQHQAATLEIRDESGDRSQVSVKNNANLSGATQVKNSSLDVGERIALNENARMNVVGGSVSCSDLTESLTATLNIENISGAGHSEVNVKNNSNISGTTKVKNSRFNVANRLGLEFGASLHVNDSVISVGDLLQDKNTVLEIDADAAQGLTSFVIGRDADLSGTTNLGNTNTKVGNSTIIREGANVSTVAGVLSSPKLVQEENSVFKVKQSSVKVNTGELNGKTELEESLFIADRLSVKSKAVLSQSAGETKVRTLEQEEGSQTYFKNEARLEVQDSRTDGLMDLDNSSFKANGTSVIGKNGIINSNKYSINLNIADNSGRIDIPLTALLAKVRFTNQKSGVVAGRRSSILTQIFINLGIVSMPERLSLQSITFENHGNIYADLVDIVGDESVLNTASINGIDVAINGNKILFRGASATAHNSLTLTSLMTLILDKSRIEGKHVTSNALLQLLLLSQISYLTYQENTLFDVDLGFAQPTRLPDSISDLFTLNKIATNSIDLAEYFGVPYTSILKLVHRGYILSGQIPALLKEVSTLHNEGYESLRIRNLIGPAFATKLAIESAVYAYKDISSLIKLKNEIAAKPTTTQIKTQPDNPTASKVKTEQDAVVPVPQPKLEENVEQPQPDNIPKATGMLGRLNEFIAKLPITKEQLEVAYLHFMALTPYSHISHNVIKFKGLISVEINSQQTAFLTINNGLNLNFGTANIDAQRMYNFGFSFYSVLIGDINSIRNFGEFYQIRKGRLKSSYIYNGNRMHLNGGHMDVDIFINQAELKLKKMQYNGKEATFGKVNSGVELNAAASKEEPGTTHIEDSLLDINILHVSDEAVIHRSVLKTQEFKTTETAKVDAACVVIETETMDQGGNWRTTDVHVKMVKHTVNELNLRYDGFLHLEAQELAQDGDNSIANESEDSGLYMRYENGAPYFKVLGRNGIFVLNGLTAQEAKDFAFSLYRYTGISFSNLISVTTKATDTIQYTGYRPDGVSVILSTGGPVALPAHFTRAVGKIFQSYNEAHEFVLNYATYNLPPPQYKKMSRRHRFFKWTKGVAAAISTFAAQTGTVEGAIVSAVAGAAAYGLDKGAKSSAKKRDRALENTKLERDCETQSR